MKGYPNHTKLLSLLLCFVLVLGQLPAVAAAEEVPCTLTEGCTGFLDAEGNCSVCSVPQPHSHSYVNGLCSCGSTCSHETYAEGLCTLCGASEPVSCDHSWDEGTVTTAATCTAEGVMTFTCTKEGCGETRTEPVTQTSHTYANGSCTVCGACEHSWDEGTVTVESTCAEKGTIAFTCIGCGQVRTASLAMGDHVFENGVCTGCGACEHSWDEGTVTVPATCTAEGTMTFSCTREGCEETKTETTEIASHTYDNGSCTVCGALEVKCICSVPCSETVNTDCPVCSAEGGLCTAIAMPAALYFSDQDKTWGSEVKAVYTDAAGNITEVLLSASSRGYFYSGQVPAGTVSFYFTDGTRQTQPMLISLVLELGTDMCVIFDGAEEWMEFATWSLMNPLADPNSGTWGGIDWTLDENGTLTIAPTKNTPVPDPNSGKTFEVGAWREAVVYKANGGASAIGGYPYDVNAVTSLVIHEGVISIGSFAAKFPNLTGEVVIPASVTYIGQETFQNTPITKLTFAAGGSGELCIAPGAFKKLAITELTLPADRPVHLHCWAFTGCYNLEQVTLPATVTAFPGWTHAEYMGMNYTNGGDSNIFSECNKLQGITFGSEEVKNKFFAAANNGRWKDPTATIGISNFFSLQGAIDGAKDGDTITLLKEFTGTAKMTDSKTVTLTLAEGVPAESIAIELAHEDVAISVPEGVTVTSELPFGHELINGVYRSYVNIAQIGETIFRYLEDVLEAAAADETISLLWDVNPASDLLIEKDTTINTNGKNITGNLILNNATLTVCHPTGNAPAWNVSTNAARKLVEYRDSDNTRTYYLVDAVAQIGDSLYASMDQALAAASGDAAIVLLADLNGSFTLDKALTIDANGYELDATLDAGSNALTVQNLGVKKNSITMPDGGTVSSTSGSDVFTPKKGQYGYSRILVNGKLYFNEDDGANVTNAADGSLKFNGDFVEITFDEAGKIVYQMTKVEDSSTKTNSFTQGSSSDMLFISNGFSKLLTSVHVDDKTVEADQYTVADGSTHVTLKDAFLKTLSLGTHTLTMNYADGGYATCTFSVVASPYIADPTNPKTGDDFNMVLYSTMAVTSLLCLAALTLTRKKVF